MFRGEQALQNRSSLCGSGTAQGVELGTEAHHRGLGQSRLVEIKCVSQKAILLLRTWTVLKTFN